jgi:serine phosphatase RsbU (regulator of sigma subunit)
MASCLTNIGNIYYWQNDLPKALEYYAKAVQAAREAGDTRSVSNGIGNQGNIYADMGDYPRGLAMLRQSMALDSAMNDRQGLAMSLNSVGSIYADMGKLDSARICFERSMAIREAINDRLGLGAVWNNMGNYHLLRKEYPKAIEYGNRAMAVAREVGNVGLQKDVANMLYETYAASGNHRMALEMFQLQRQMTDSLESVESQQEVMRQQFQYDFDKKEALLAAEQDKKDALAAEQLKRRQQERNGLIIGLVLMLGLAGLGFNSYRIKRRDNAIITAQKQEVERQKAVVDARNTDIMHSFEYARRLQEAVLPPSGGLAAAFPESFLIYLPRDVVSGDFHWTAQQSGATWLAVGDCTGHGVPGAMLSVMGLNSLNRCVNDMGLTRPKDVLQQMTLDLLVAFEGSAHTVRDGMDMALCRIDRHSMTLTYAGANSAALVVRSGEAHVLRPARRPVGHHEGDVAFAQEEFALIAGDRIYLMSDGYPDQQGGTQGKKYLTKRLRDLIVTLSEKSMHEQRDFLLHEFSRWKGDFDQTDDVCIVGVRV